LKPGSTSDGGARAGEESAKEQDVIELEKKQDDAVGAPETSGSEAAGAAKGEKSKQSEGGQEGTGAAAGAGGQKQIVERLEETKQGIQNPYA